MDTLPDIGKNPSWGLAVEETARVIRHDFGDGYSQRAANGINSIDAAVPVSWGKITLAKRDTLLAFFRAKAGHTAFYWTPPQEVAPRKWTCTKWSYPAAAPGYVTFTAQFREEFDLA